jgi:hypothetical protein
MAAYFTKLNDEGGVNGRKIKLISLMTAIVRRRPSSRRASWSSRTKFSAV